MAVWDDGGDIFQQPQGGKKDSAIGRTGRRNKTPPEQGPKNAAEQSTAQQH